MKRNYYYILGLVIFALAFFQCSTQKNTFITRTYHNVTARYNILFNGSESFKKGVRKIEDTYPYNYSEILPVFLYGSEETASKVSSEMDRTIKKGTKLISMHSITVKPELKSNKPLTPEQQMFYNKKEFNEWVDDNYFLMGKAYFYKNDYTLAIQTFRFILNTYEDPEILYKTKVWLARTYIQLQEYENAEEILVALENDEEYPKKLKVDLQATYADYYLKQHLYSDAIPYLKKASKKAKGKSKKIRYTYILAQLYNLAGNSNLAIKKYGEVIKMNPPYETTFNAKISQALAYESGLQGSKGIYKQLEKMLRDDKNIEFQDQIYYALGNISMEEGKLEQAVEYYRLSAQKSLSNIDQKAKSYLTLANIYYDTRDYEHAQTYYDSAVILINNDYPDYDLIFAKSRSLTSLVTEVKTVRFEDSVQILAQMPTNELYAYIDDVIDEVKRKEEEERLLQAQRLLDKQYNAQMAANKIQDPTAKASWYFYNETAKTLGRKEFITKWGNRSLEDNWRRKNKSSVAIQEVTAEKGDVMTDEEKAEQAILSNKTREYYLVNIPLTDSLMEQSHKRIESALYKMANIYENDLKDFDEAIKAYKELIERYPDTKHKLDSYFSLYKIYNKQDNTAMTQVYKNRIISEFPNSNYTKLLTNPDYIKELEAEQNRVNNLYASLYNDYQQGRYNQVIRKSEDALKEFPEDNLVPQFSYLRALCIGKTSDVKTFREELENIVADFPQTEVSEEAKNIIAYIDSYKPEIKEEKETQVAKEIYITPENNTPHYFVFLIKGSLDINQLVFNIINFNLDNFDDLNLTASKEKIENQNIVIIKTFESKALAIKYLRQIATAKDIYNDVDKQKLSEFVISEENYKILLSDKSVDRYLKYFKETYNF